MNSKIHKNNWQSVLKGLSKIIAIITIIIFAFFSQLNAQVYIRVCPRPPVYVRPAAPHPGHIWIDGDWVYNGHGYVWREGYWAPVRPGSAWIQGHWKNSRRGYRWIPGHWR